jgi:hypothetical protein
MKLILVFALLLQSAFAATKLYDISVTISMNGKVMVTPRLLLKEGKKGSILQESKDGRYFLDVVASEGTIEKSILLDFTTGILMKEGSRKILSRGKILAEEAPVTLLAPQLHETEDFEMTIQARRKFQK